MEKEDCEEERLSEPMYNTKLLTSNEELNFQ